MNPQEVKHFFLHLRLPYQIFILPGGYLLGGLLADEMNPSQFWLQFLNVHILLYGGATAYNSYWDKDEGPVGGLKHPPKMTGWMHPASLLFMGAGMVWALTQGRVYATVFGAGMLLFWLYSTPLQRWKARPHLSVAAIAVSTGLNPVLLGTLAAGGTASLSAPVLACGLGASLVLVSLYPVSQVYQSGEDRRRGDMTFYRKYGLRGVRLFFANGFLGGLTILCTGFFFVYKIPALILFITGLLSFVILYTFVARLKGNPHEYKTVMSLKLFASLSFVLFLLGANAIRYGWFGETVLGNYF